MGNTKHIKMHFLTRLRNPRGNALFLILIAVALFAALSYAVTQSGRGSGTTDRERAELTAARFASYGASLSTAVMRLTLTGCSETQLNFENTTLVHPDYWGGSSNTNAPTDGSCDVFKASGGGQTYWAPGSELPLDSGALMTISSEVAVNNVGTSASDLIVWVALNNSSFANAICTAYNRKMGNSGDLTGGTTRTLDWGYARGAGLTFVADQTTGPMIIGEDPSPSGLNGRIGGCIIGPTSHDGDMRLLYFVIKER